MSHPISRLIATLTVVLCLAAALTAKQATASLDGVVVSGDTPAQPVRRAVVTVTGPDLPRNLSTVTDDDGRFGFSNLKPGRYQLSVSKAAYLTTAFGATQPGRPGTPLALTAGQWLADVRLVLMRGAVLTGLIRDLTGAPAPNVQITAVPAAAANGPSDYASPPEGPALTDDAGMYRVYGLPPGEYVIAASSFVPRSASVFQVLGLPPDQRLGGAAGLDARVTGGARTYAPVFYPGTPVVRDATRVAVGIGEVRGGLDFALELVPSLRVEGRFVTNDGSSAPRVQPMLKAIGPPLPVFSSMNVNLDQRPDGAFTFSNVTPGRYVLTARGAPEAGAADASDLWAMTEIDVGQTDRTDLVLTMHPALRFSGRVVFDPRSTRSVTDLTSISVRLMRAPLQDAASNACSLWASGFCAPAHSSLDADGTFTVSNVMPGTYLVSSSLSAASGWWLRSAVAGGRDLLDFPLEVGGADEDIRGAVLTFSDRRSGLSGTLQSTSGRPAPQHYVVVVPADPALWTAARRVRSTRPASDGRFSFADLPAGLYMVAALTDLDPEWWRDPSFRAQLAAVSVMVTIPEGAMVQQDLRIQ